MDVYPIGYFSLEGIENLVLIKTRNMETENFNCDTDPTGNLEKRVFEIWRLWGDCETQKELVERSGKPLGKVKGVLNEVYGILMTSDKGKAMHLSWKMGIFTLRNCDVPK